MLSNENLKKPVHVIWKKYEIREEKIIFALIYISFGLFFLFLKRFCVSYELSFVPMFIK